MLAIRGLSISRKLTLMNMLVSSAALLLASIAFFSFDFHSFKQEVVRQLSTEAQIIGSNSVSALVSNDTQAAENTLTALRASPHVVYAAIYNAGGTLFADYRRPGAGSIRVTSLGSEPFGYSFQNSQFSVILPVVFEGNIAGKVYLISDTKALANRKRRYLQIMGGILLASLFAAFVVSRASQRGISEPMTKLAETAKLVSQKQNYSLRADTIDTEDEVSTVINAFNDMLGRIEQRGADLQNAHDELEQRVKRRTAELEDRTTQVAEQARLLDLANDAIFVRTADSKISYWNSGAERLYGWTKSEAIGSSPHELLQTEFPVPLEELTRRDRWEGELWQRRRDGSRIIVGSRWTTLRDKNEQFAGWLEICTDITARKQAEKAARRLSSRILNIQDDERRRMARELHDSLGQYLVALKMSLDLLEREVTLGSSQNPSVVLKSCSELLERAISETRTISHLLHPPLLDEVGLLSAMNWFVEGFSKRSGILANMDVPSQYSRLPQETEITLFRVLQEALTNVHRHSGSSQVDIMLRVTGADVWLKVEDYGQGIPDDRLKQIQEENAQIGVGLAGMKERVHQLEGSLEITSSLTGTSVSVRIPISESSKVPAANKTSFSSRENISVA
ncbi:MAG: ATP-binding protein [Terriglobales bacterium]|jgi:PAS domain S-box-containing protein